ncbi:hypothetical protein [Streptomyces rimosus]|uniref:hypothetical protein n=1 Tax=Streptomyces rimosus TaxID=1927 RepID=UPI001ADD9D44|nr:hypothetical protein [Streptomyces rimosus]QTL84870.1 hypothetical protein FMM49_02850 [Streptomyces rimosus subsp. rimosus]
MAGVSSAAEALVTAPALPASASSAAGEQRAERAAATSWPASGPARRWPWSRQVHRLAAAPALLRPAGAGPGLRDLRRALPAVPRARRLLAPVLLLGLLLTVLIALLVRGDRRGQRTAPPAAPGRRRAARAPTAPRAAPPVPPPAGRRRAPGWRRSRAPSWPPAVRRTGPSPPPAPWA